MSPKIRNNTPESVLFPSFEQAKNIEHSETYGKKQVQGGAPPVISWFIIPINYRYNPLINPSYWT